MNRKKREDKTKNSLYTYLLSVARPRPAWFAERSGKKKTTVLGVTCKAKTD